MKKVFWALTILFTLNSCNNQKIAYVDIGNILEEYQGSKNAEKKMREKSEKLMAEMEPEARQFQLKVQEYQKNSSKLSSKAKAEKEQELMQEQQILQQKQQMAQQQVQQEGQQIIKDIDDKIETFLKEYAKSNGYSLILGTSSQTKSVIYGEEALDITDIIIEELNNAYSEKNSNEVSNKTEEPETVN